MSKRARNEDRLLAFFSILSEDSSNENYDEGKTFALARLKERMRKRAAFIRPELQQLAINKFVETNEAVGAVSIDKNCPVLCEARDFIYHALARFHSRIDPDDSGGVMHFETLSNNWRFGPGSSNGIRGTHTAEKISAVFTCTGPCEPIISALRRRNRYFQLIDERNGTCGTLVVKGSRLTTVPKNEDSVRTIAIEPLGNMAMQLAAGRYLEDVLRSIGLDITLQQPLNKKLAQRGSVDGSLATIDLSAASDSISIPLVRALFPSEWLSLFLRLRSGETELPDGRSVTMNMISTMGNGFTFPLMTFIFVALIYGYRRLSGGPKHFVSWSDTAVFGDDIIIPSFETEKCVRALNNAGFTVNADKSYWSGPFRESCGGDYYLGYDVTPFYVKTLARPSDIYVAINQVLEYCGRHNFVFFRSLKYLFGLLNNKVLLVPEWMNPDQGILTKGCPKRYTYLSQVHERKKLRDEFFLMPLAIGGFVESAGAHAVYTPRTSKEVRYAVRRARLPSGYLDGWSADKRLPNVSDFIQLIIELVLT